MSSYTTPSPPVSVARKSTRIHYLDWLRVLAILIVFLFHAVHSFDYGGWHIKNLQQSEILTIILTILGLWGMPFFLVHQPAIVIIAFFVVQWAAGIPVKMLAVVVSSFVVCLFLYEFAIRRIPLLRSLFGMTSKPSKPPKPGLVT